MVARRVVPLRAFILNISTAFIKQIRFFRSVLGVQTHVYGQKMGKFVWNSTVRFNVTNVLVVTLEQYVTKVVMKDVKTNSVINMGFVKVAQGVIIMIHKVYQHVQSVQKIVMIQIQLIPYVNL
jgi:hypothetical protein